MADTITIDDQDIPFEPGQTIIEAARAAGLYIEHLCYNPQYQPHGSCKLCSVMVDGQMQTACTMPAQAGQQVESASPRMKARREALTEMHATQIEPRVGVGTRLEAVTE